MKLHNRQIKGSFWSDPDLIYELSREQRMFFIGIIQLAEDSGCLEYDARPMKMLLYPADNDITPEILDEWIKKLIQMGKLIIYEVEGKKYLYLKNFHKHQSLRFMAPPEVPLPPWVQWQQKDERERYGKYVISNGLVNGHINNSQNEEKEDIHRDIYTHIHDDIHEEINADINDDINAHKLVEVSISNKTYVSEFEEFWKNYPRKTDKKQAYFQWKARIKSGVSSGDLLLAAKNYAAECRQVKREERYIKHAKTFIGAHGSYEEYLKKEEYFEGINISNIGMLPDPPTEEEEEADRQRFLKKIEKIKGEMGKTNEVS